MAIPNTSSPVTAPNSPPARRKPYPRGPARRAFVIGLLTAPLATALLAVAARILASPSGWGYAVGFAIATVGLLTMPWRTRRGVTRAGVGLVALVALARLLFADGTQLDTVRLPGDGRRLVNRLLDERDGTLLAAHALVLTHRVPRSDAREFVPALESAFDRLDAAEGPVATPAIATWLGLQSTDGFDAVVIRPAERKQDTAVVLLHGYAGNFAVYCWQLSRAARAISALTVCPSVGPKGDWWSPQGAKTLERTLAWLAGQGVQRVYLAGLSNGGVGASVLASRVSHPGIQVRGLVLISGADPRAPVPSVPVLLVQGARDSMMPAWAMRAFSQRLGRRATYVEVDSGHFAFLDRHEACEKAIAAWLVARERGVVG